MTDGWWTKAFKKGISSFEYLRYLIFLQLKLFRLPHGHAVRTFEFLVSHVKAHYNHCYSTYIASVIRNLVSFASLLLVQLCSKGSGVGGKGGGVWGDISYWITWWTVFSCHGKMSRLLLQLVVAFWSGFIVYATVKDDFALPGNHAIRFTCGNARFPSFFSGDQTIPREPCPHKKDA